MYNKISAIGLSFDILLTIGASAQLFGHNPKIVNGNFRIEIRLTKSNLIVKGKDLKFTFKLVIFDFQEERRRSGNWSSNSR